MKKTLTILILILVTLWACNTQSPKVTNQIIVQQFYSGMNSGNYTDISRFISNDIKVTEGDFTLAQNKNDFYTQFQWDSVFSPSYKFDIIAANDSLVDAMVEKECRRILFLHDTSMSYMVQFKIFRNKIKVINTVQYVNLDLERWQYNLKLLSNWMETTHPELMGSQYELTMEGAQKYLKAIELFENQ